MMLQLPQRDLLYSSWRTVCVHQTDSLQYSQTNTTLDSSLILYKKNLTPKSLVIHKMSSLTAQESTANQGDLPINQGTGSTNTSSGSDSSVPFKVGNEPNKGLDAATTDKVRWMTCFPSGVVRISDAKQQQTSYGNNASGTSETRRGEDLSFQQEGEGSGFVGKKTGSESLIDSIEGSVHERGEAGDFDSRS